MTEHEFNTERERYTIGVIGDSIKEVNFALMDKLSELKDGCNIGDEDALEKSFFIKLRIDTLWKIENLLLNELSGEYLALDKSLVDGKKPDVFEVIRKRQDVLIAAMLQGI
jgi:hypothetical protein